MSVVMPPLLLSAQLKLDIIISSADSDNENDKSVDDRNETITLGDERIEEKVTACKMLYFYVDELKEGFYPWIDQVAQTLVPLLKFCFHEEVKRAGVSVMLELLRSAKLSVEKGNAQDQNETYLKQLSDCIIPALVEALHKEPNTVICIRVLDAVFKCLEISGPLLDEGQIRSIVDEIKQVLTDILNLKRERAERTKFEDFDAEESDLIEIEEEEDFFHCVGNILCELIITFKAAFIPFFDELSSFLMPMWGKDKTTEERMAAINIFNSFSDHFREAGLKYYDTYVPLILEACDDESSDVRLNMVVLFLSLLLENNFISEALSRLTIAIAYPNALQPENVIAYINVVSALGKICQFHRDSIDSAQVIPTWLNCLPIKADEIEVEVVHDQLCSMFERSDGELLGPNNQYLPKIVSVFAEVLCASEYLASKQTQSRMINLLKQLQQTLPTDSLASIWSSLKPHQQIALQSILSS